MNGPFELRINTGPEKNAAGYLIPFNRLVNESIQLIEEKQKSKENCSLM